MAKISLNSPSPFTITYTISEMTPIYVDTAIIELYKLNEQAIYKKAVHRSIDTAHIETLFGYFTDLRPNTGYRVHSCIYDKNGNITSDREDSITTGPEFKGTLNTHVHSINISTGTEVYNTFENWGLVPATRPSVPPPELKSEYVNLPASDGVLDYTEILLGKIPFGRRTGSWRFYTDEIKMESLGYTWNTLYNLISGLIHGVKCEISLDDDPDFYYVGRLSVNQWRSLAAFSEITIDFNLDSYKYSRIKSDDVDWQWDTVLGNPEETILYGNYATQEFKVLSFLNEFGQPIVPTLNSDNNINVRANLGTLVQEVIRGEWGQGQDRFDRLTAAGYCWQIVQNMVNEALGIDYRYPVPPDAMTDKTQEALNDGSLYSGEDYSLITGENINENLSLSPGNNTMVFRTQDENQGVNIHMVYSGVAL